MVLAVMIKGPRKSNPSLFTIKMYSFQHITLTHLLGVAVNLWVYSQVLQLRPLKVRRHRQHENMNYARESVMLFF